MGKKKANKNRLGASLGAVKAKNTSCAFNQMVDKTHVVVRDKKSEAVVAVATKQAKGGKRRKGKATGGHQAERDSEYAALEARARAAVLSKERARIRGAEKRSAPAVLAFQPPSFHIGHISVQASQTVAEAAARAAAAPMSHADQMLAQISDDVLPGATGGGGAEAEAGGGGHRRGAARRTNPFAALAGADDDDPPLAFAAASFQLPAEFSAASLPGSGVAAPANRHAAFHAAFAGGVSTSAPSLGLADLQARGASHVSAGDL